MKPIDLKVESEAGLSLSQSKEQVNFYVNGYL